MRYFCQTKRLTMKKLFLFVLSLSTLVYSQKNIKVDTIVSRMGNSHQCFITYVDDDYIMLRSEDGTNLKFFVETIESIKIEELGDVYSDASGFNLPLDSIEVFLIKRNKKHAFNSPEIVAMMYGYEETQLFNGDKKWFFAIYYFPSITKQLVFTYVYSPYSPLDFRYYPQIVYELEQNLISMESQFGFNVYQNLFVTLSLGYSSDLYRSSSTSTNNNYNYPEQTVITENQNSMDKFLFEFGIKQYFCGHVVNSVSPFITFSIGKQLAFADNYFKSYQLGQSNNYYQTNNESEFMEGLNSPIFVSIGFGAEYAISESLSLSGFFKVKYSSASSTYNWKNFANETVTDYGHQDVEITDVKYKTGLGLTFFF